MKEVEVFCFCQPPVGNQRKPRRTRWKMTIEEGKKRFPEGWPDLLSREVRRLPSTQAELDAGRTPAQGHSGGFSEEALGRSLREYEARMRKGDGH